MGDAKENARPEGESGRAQVPTCEMELKPTTDFDDHLAGQEPPRKPSSADAELLSEAGFQLVQLGVREKVPTRRNWNELLSDNSAVIAAIQHGFNAGVRLDGRHVVIDVDPKNGGEESLARLVANLKLDLSRCPTTHTGSGGAHYYLRKPKDAQLVTNLREYPGIDFKSSGQVVAPGSIHPNGKAYTSNFYAYGPDVTPDAPYTLLSLLERRSGNVGSADRSGELTPRMLRANLQQLDPDEFADYSTWMNMMMACHHATAGEGLDEFTEWSTQGTGYADAAEAIAYKWNGLSVDERGVTVQYLYRQLHDRGLVVHDRPEPEDDFDQVEDQSTMARGDEERFRFLTREEVRSMPPPRWLVEGFIQEQTISAIYGAPESGKSFLAIDFVMSIAAGTSWQGRNVTQGAVLYVAAEGVLSLNNRFHAWEVEHGMHGMQDVPLSLMRSSLNLTSTKEAEAFCKAMERLGPLRMIVVDTLNQTSAGADENSASDMGRYIDAMKRMRDTTGAAVVVVHHSGKDASKGMRGSTALLAGVDTAIEVVRPDKNAPALYIKVQKQKDAEKEKPIHFEMVKQADSMVLRMTRGSLKESDVQFVASSLSDWIASWLDGQDSAPFKDLIQARRAYLGKGSESSVRDELKKHLGEGFDNAKVCSDGTRIWLEREAGNLRGALIVHAVRKETD